MSLSDYLIAEIRRVAERPTMREDMGAERGAKAVDGLVSVGSCEPTTRRGLAGPFTHLAAS